jgi:tetratricopeptide (TPR) repeat protein
MTGVMNVRTACLLILLLGVAINSFYPGEVSHHSRYLLILLSSLAFLLVALQQFKQGMNSLDTCRLVGTAAVFLVLLPSYFTSINKDRSQEVFFLFLAYSLLILVLLWVRPSFQQTLWIVVSLGFIALTIDLMSLHQYFFGLKRLRLEVQGAPFLDEEFRNRLLGRIHSQRVFGNFPLPNTLAGFVACLLPIQIYFAYASYRGFFREQPVGQPGRNYHHAIPLLLLLPVGLSLWVLTLTQSFGGWVCFFGSVLVGGFLLASHSINQRRKWILLAMTGFLVLLMAWMLWISHKRGFGLFNLAAPNNPIVLRSLNYGIAFTVFREFPWTGVGLGNYGEINPRYQSSPLNVARYAHCTPVQLLAEAGILAVPAFLLILGQASRRWRVVVRLARDSGIDQRYLSIALLASIAAWGIHNLIDINLYFPSLGGLGIFIMGVLLSHTPEDNQQGTPRSLSRRLSMGLMGGATLAFCVLFWTIGHLYMAETLFLSAKSLVEDNKLVQAEREIEESLSLNPNNPAAVTLAARVRLQLAIQKDTVDVALLRATRTSYERAVALEPFNAEIHYELGRILIALGERELACQAWHRSQQLFPAEPKFRIPYTTSVSCH